MQVVRLRTLDELAEVADAWNSLAAGVPFRTWEWNSTWWRHYQDDGELYVLRLEDAAGIVALAPWFVSRHPARGTVIRYLASGEVCSDYQTILCRPGREADATAALADWLVQAATAWRRGDNWDLIDFSGIQVGDPVSWPLLERLRARGCQVATQEGLNCWRLEFPPTWDEYLARLSKSHRGHVRRLDRNIFQSGRAVWHMAKTAEEFLPAMETLVDLHQRRWQSRGLAGVFTSPRFTAFHGDIAQRLLALGNLRLQWLELDGRPAAAEYHFAGGGVSYFYQSGLDPDLLDESPGALAHIGAIKSAFADGLHAIDFLRGDEPYKPHWRAEPRPCRDARVVPPRLSSRVRNGAWETGRRMKHWLDRVSASSQQAAPASHDHQDQQRPHPSTADQGRT